jgi:hypothetical protein
MEEKKVSINYMYRRNSKIQGPIVFNSLKDKVEKGKKKRDE